MSSSIPSAPYVSPRQKCHLQATILNMNSVLRVQFYQLAMSDRAVEVAGWQGANPINLLEDAAVSLETETIAKYPELARFHAVAAGLGASYRGEFWDQLR